MKTKSIQVFFILLFIYSVFLPLLLLFLLLQPVALWDASISGCLGSRQSLSSNKATAAHRPLPLHRLHRIAIPHIHFFSPSLPSLSFSFSTLPSPSISASAHFDAAFTSTLLLSVGFSGLGPPLLTTACLSLRQKAGLEKKAVPPSVNKCLISRLLVPVCLSVCLACRQLSLRSGVAVSQVLVSVLLSVHLPVRASQIRRVNLATVFFLFFF